MPNSGLLKDWLSMHPRFAIAAFFSMVFCFNMVPVFELISDSYVNDSAELVTVDKYQIQSGKSNGFLFSNVIFYYHYNDSQYEVTKRTYKANFNSMANLQIYVSRKDPRRIIPPNAGLRYIESLAWALFMDLFFLIIILSKRSSKVGKLLRTPQYMKEKPKKGKITIEDLLRQEGRW